MMCKRHISFKAENIVKYRDLLLTFELVCNECKPTLEQHHFCWIFSLTTDVEKFTHLTSIFVTGLKKKMTVSCQIAKFKMPFSQCVFHSVLNTLLVP